MNWLHGRTTWMYHMNVYRVDVPHFCMGFLHGGNAWGSREEILLGQHWQVDLVNDLIGLRARLVINSCALAVCRLSRCTRTQWAATRTMAVTRWTSTRRTGAARLGASHSHMLGNGQVPVDRVLGWGWVGVCEGRGWERRLRGRPPCVLNTHAK